MLWYAGAVYLSPTSRHLRLSVWKVEGPKPARTYNTYPQVSLSPCTQLSALLTFEAIHEGARGRVSPDSFLENNRMKASTRYSSHESHARGLPRNQKDSRQALYLPLLPKSWGYQRLITCELDRKARRNSCCGEFGL